MSANNRNQIELANRFGEDAVVEVDGELRLKVEVDGKRHTVELREPLPFEEQLIDDLIEPSATPGITGAAEPIKGKWIAGWLEYKDEDYINNIWHNYQFFLKYLEIRTSRIENVSTYQRAPGTYDSMYRYIILLEDLELVERFRRETVPEDEYDFPVPEEFRTRVFVRITTPFSERPNAWRNPYESFYPGGEKKEEEAEEVEIEVEPGEEEPSGLEEFVEPGEEEDAGTTEEEEGPSGLEEFAPEMPEPPEEEMSIAEFPDLDGLMDLVELYFDDAIESAFNQAPIPTSGIDPDDYELGRVGIFGVWAQGEAMPGEDELSMVISIDDSNASRSPGFIPAGFQTSMRNLLSVENPYEDYFPSYEVVGVYNSAFRRTVDESVRETQTQLVFFNLNQKEFVELE